MLTNLSAHKSGFEANLSGLETDLSEFNRIETKLKGLKPDFSKIVAEQQQTGSRVAAASFCRVATNMERNTRYRSRVSAE